MSNSNLNSNQPQQVQPSSAISTQPIVDLVFQGLHWIEASAGTGKTYTLSSLMVRILLEKYLPKEVIATTFTRKAAAELKSRIRSRLYEVYAAFDDCRSLSETQVQARAQQSSDPLLAKVLHDFAHQVAYACERLKLVIDQLDELFVGTLDSFSQKLLKEFAFESGKIERAEITDEAKSYSDQLIHDVLRAWIQQQSQPLLDALLQHKKLKSPSAYVAVVESSLNFSSAYFQAPKQPKIDLAAQQAQLDAFVELDLSCLPELAAYSHPDGAQHSILAKKWRDHARLDLLLHQQLPALIAALAQQGDAVLSMPQYAASLKDLTELSSKKVLNKCPEDVLVAFEQHPIIVAIRDFCQGRISFTAELDLLDSYLQYYLASEVKKRLPQLLQQKGETTFSQQIRTLAEALQGAQGQRFASYVHARYPLILVDEFQDTNQDQDDMLAQIWRYPERVQRGCMIMVGDRKQAIYGFRGGDMLTFLKAYQDVCAQQGRMYHLVHNHRSIRPLVEVVDCLFQRQPDFGEAVIYQAVEAGSRPHPDLIDLGAEVQRNPSPLRWIFLDPKATAPKSADHKHDEAEQVAWKIAALLNQASQSQLYFDEETGPRALEASDIAILSRNHDGLDKSQYALQRLGIAVNRPSKKSVFESQIAKDVGAVLTAILNPYDEAKLKRALLSRLMGFDLRSVLELQQQSAGLAHYIERFDQFRHTWLKLNFLSAWQQFLNEFQVWQAVVQQPSRDNERAVVNLRHLSELLSQHSEHYQGAQHLYHWYVRQLTSPAEREWELERQLSNVAGVQLLTIHQSKGLEFKIVFLLGADKPFRENLNKTLNFSTMTQADPVTGQPQLQRVIAINDQQQLAPEAVEQHSARAHAEQHRLWYVALTRASYRVYAMMQDLEGKSNTGLAFWSGAPNAFQHPHSSVEAVLTERPARVRSQKTEILPLSAERFPQQRFYARGKTSFSYLAQHLTRQQIQDSLVLAEQQLGQADDEAHSMQPQAALSQSTLQPLTNTSAPDALAHAVGAEISWIQANFPMGALAGNFLHEMFEQIDFQDQSAWALALHRRFKNDYRGLWQSVLEKFQQHFPEHEDAETQLYADLMQWISQVLETPINAVNTPIFRLVDLNADAYLSEFPFYLSLSDQVFSTQRIHQLFAEYQIEMPTFNTANAARYLNGSIDLLYYDGARYHIADYKSNFLGTQLMDYQADAIQRSMQYASYWLQAGLYLVALHRYLKVHLQDYQIEQHLGGASYIYLRGMNGSAAQGHVYWKPEDEFILRLDAILGYFAEDKTSIASG